MSRLDKFHSTLQTLRSGDADPSALTGGAHADAKGSAPGLSSGAPASDGTSFRTDKSFRKRRADTEKNASESAEQTRSTVQISESDICSNSGVESHDILRTLEKREKSHDIVRKLEEELRAAGRVAQEARAREERTYLMYQSAEDRTKDLQKKLARSDEQTMKLLLESSPPALSSVDSQDDSVSTSFARSQAEHLRSAVSWW